MVDSNFGLSTIQILRKLSSQLGVDYDGGEIKVIRYEREYLMFIYLPVRGGGQGNLIGTPSFFEIKTKIPYSHPFFGIRKSNSLDWVAEHVLSLPDYQVGDADFDTKFYIKVKDKDWGSRFFSKISVRQGIEDLLLQGFDLIRSEAGDLKVVKYLSLGNPYPTVEMIKKAIEQLDKIISNFPNNYISTDTSERSDKDIPKSSIKDLMDANRELIFGQMDGKSMQRLWILILVLLIVGVFAYWRLIAFELAP